MLIGCLAEDGVFNCRCNGISTMLPSGNCMVCILQPLLSEFPFWVVLAGANPFRTSFGNIKCSDWFIRGALLYYQSIDLEYESYKDAVGLVQQ